MEQKPDYQSGDSIRSEASRDAASVASEARQAFSQATDPVVDKARNYAEERKYEGAGQIDSLGRSVHAAADELGKEIPQAASYIHSAADSIQQASSRLRDRSIEELMGDFSDFARNQPAAAFAGSVLAGFAISRFLKSSRSHPIRS
jgi:hypothetical protein